MTGEIVPIPKPDGALRLLHQQIEALATEAAQAYTSRTPIRIEDNGIGDEMQIWFDQRGLKVFTSGGSVHIATTLRFNGDWPNWHTITDKTGRALVNAILSAMAYVARTTSTDSNSQRPVPKISD